MWRELFTIPVLGLPVYGYGLMLVLGVWIGAEVAKHIANRLGLNGDHFVTMCIVALVSGVVGARLSHVLENLDVYTDSSRSVAENLRAAVNITSGGLTFYGGFIFATGVILIYTRIKGIPMLRGIDVIAPCLMLGLMFGRVGCLLNGCCWGQICDREAVPWAITFPYGSPPFEEHYQDGDLDEGSIPAELFRTVPNENGMLVQTLIDPKDVAKDERLSELAAETRSLPVHPTQLYSSLNGFLLFGLSLAYLTLLPAPGRVAALVLMSYAPARFTIELLRVNTPLAGDLTYSMWVSIFVFTAGLVLFFAAGRIAARTESISPAASSTTSS